MKYKEQLPSKLIYRVGDSKYKIKLLSKKARKVWKQRKEYFSKEYKEQKRISKSERQKNIKRTVTYSKEPSEKTISSKNQKLAVYTCVFGNYDKIREPFFKSKYCDYFIITDLEVPQKSAWKKIMQKNVPKDFENWHPAIKNRYYKMHPQYVFEDYEYSLYIDGNLRPMADLYPFVLKLRRKNGIIGMFKHPCFNCLYDSAEHLKNINLVEKSTMDLQINKYRNEGYPAKYGFFECNFILRKHNDQKCKDIMEDWWLEYVNHVKRDQQSMTYALWKNGLSFSDVCVFGNNIRNDSRLKLYIHKEKHKKVIQKVEI